MKITRKPVQVVMGHDAGNMCAVDMYAHEVDIQKVIRGEEKVTFIKDLDPTKMNMAPYEVDSREELVRLKRKYQSQRDPDGVNPVDAIFPDGSRDLEEFYKEGAEKKEVTTKDPKPPKEPDMPESPKVKSRQDIIAELTALNVSFAQTQPTQQLIAKLAEAKAGANKDE